MQVDSVHFKKQPHFYSQLTVAEAYTHHPSKRHQASLYYLERKG